MRKVTQTLLVFAVTSLAGYDAWVYRTAGTDATISAVVHDFAVDWPIAGIAMGAVVGHIFWPFRSQSHSQRVANVPAPERGV